MTIRASGRIRIPPPITVRLASGITLLLFPRPGLPLVSYDVVVGRGSAADPPGREGLAAAMYGLLRKGTRRRSGEEFSRAVDSLGGVVGTWVEHDHGRLSAEFLSGDAEEGLALLSEALVEPTFPEEEVVKRREQSSDAIRADKDYPPAVIGRYFDGALFSGHAYGRPVGGDEVTLRRVVRDDVAALHRVEVDPSRIVVAVAGDFDPDRMTRDVERRFASLFTAGAPGGNGRAAAGAPAPAAGAAPARDAARDFDPSMPDPTPVAGRHVLLVDAPEEATCYFRFGNVGVPFDDPEWGEIHLAATILGGQFTSWLNMALRVESGLTYGVRAIFSRRRRRGSFFVASFTPAEHAARAIAMAEAELTKLHERGVTDEEVESARSYILGQFPLSIETADQVAQAYALLEAYGVDGSFLDTYLGRLERATAAGVNAAARRAFPWKDLVFTLVGPAESLRPVAAALGEVREKKIEDPGF